MRERYLLQLIRLRTGEDLISLCYENFKDNVIHLLYPKTFYSNYDSDADEESVTMVDWLPKYAYALPYITLPRTEILFLSYSTKMFGVEYLTDILDSIEEDDELYDLITSSLKGIIGESAEEEPGEYDLENMIPKNKSVH